jgi:hypothetical protein
MDALSKFEEKYSRNLSFASWDKNYRALLLFVGGSL